MIIYYVHTKKAKIANVDKFSRHLALQKDLLVVFTEGFPA